MSLALAPDTPTSAQGRPNHKPFRCSVCARRFTRHENLKRHAAVHSKSPEAYLSCELCSATFSRSDLRTRHLKRKHPRHHERLCQASRKRPVERRQSMLSDDVPSNSDERSDAFSPATVLQGRPDLESSSLPVLPNSSCFDSSNHPDTPTQQQPMSQATFESALALFDFDQWSPDAVVVPKKNHGDDDWCTSGTQTAYGRQLFFDHISHFLPIIHEATLDLDEAPRYLLLSMLCLAYQYGEDPDDNGRLGSGEVLSTACFRQARALIAAEEKKEDEATHTTLMVQSYLMLQIFAMMYSPGQDSQYGLKTHSKMVALARASGFMQPMSVEATATEDLDSLWRQFVKAESHKRTLFAIHQIDTLWYQFLSIPRSLSHLEIKHDLPCTTSHWTAPSSRDWAHRQLVARNVATPIRYHEAIRRFLSADHESIPDFDPYGAVNITQFFISSAREASGWSTMTGLASMDRLNPLLSSLIALDSRVRQSSPPHPPPSQTPAADPAKTPPTLLHQVTWQNAMIEMYMWSPAHTGGIVEGSIDAALHGLSFVTPSPEILRSSSIAESIRPYIDWSLRYLDATRDAALEAPWITLYAYQAFMIAWQLFKVGVEEPLQAVGVRDVEGALAWAKRVFGLRGRWKLGRVVLACVEELDRV